MLRPRTLSLIGVGTLVAIAGVVTAAVLLRSPREREQTPRNLLPVPDRAAAVAIVSETMEQFAVALLRNDFTEFYKGISSRWQTQITTQKLADAFGTFSPFGREVERAIRRGDPTLNAPPRIDDKGILRVSGFYRIEATKMLFEMQYIQEDRIWKLFGIDVSVK